MGVVAVDPTRENKTYYPTLSRLKFGKRDGSAPQARPHFLGPQPEVWVGAVEVVEGGAVEVGV